MVSKQLLGIDWGTSNRRAYLLGADGACIARVTDDQGVLALADSFPVALSALRQRLGIGPDVPVVLSGMVGSAAGWQEAPYLEPVVPLEALPERRVPVRNAPQCTIVPGYRYADGQRVDVMRGEEMQLLGVVASGCRDGCIVLPGTHSKWVHLKDGHIDRFATYMTGELFALLGKGGTLASLMGEGADDEDAFKDGLARARDRDPLSSSLFGVRAKVVTGAMPAACTRSFVSGLLIGTEFASAGNGWQTVHVVGVDALARRYAIAAEYFGMAADVLDPDAVYLAALRQFQSKEQ